MLRIYDSPFVYIKLSPELYMYDNIKLLVRNSAFSSNDPLLPGRCMRKKLNINSSSFDNG